MQIFKRIPESVMQVSIWSDGKKYWLVFTDNDGGWIFNKEITKLESNTLRANGMEYNLDRGMVNPDE